MLTSPCAELIHKRILHKADMREQRDWCCVATLNPQNGSRCIYAIGGKTYSQVELRSIE